MLAGQRDKATKHKQGSHVTCPGAIGPEKERVRRAFGVGRAAVGVSASARNLKKNRDQAAKAKTKTKDQAGFK